MRLLPAYHRLVGRCSAILFIALIFDVVGLVLLLVGICANLSAWDFYIYTGAIVIALSLIFWMFWYTFNIEISNKEFLAEC